MAYAAPAFNIGDTYVKTGDIRHNIWVVIRAWTHVDGILHVQLAKQAQTTDLITVSAATLSDSTYFRPAAS